jgi:anti-sigma regulatory factor (Ser/Thr protein kinase)
MPSPAAAPFRHEALLYDGPEGFVEGTVPFLREGIEGGEPIMVAVGAERIRALRGALGPDAGAVRFVDMAHMGRNPGRIISAWHDFADDHSQAAAIRGIGEPVWAGRSPGELVECQLHEGLLNIAFADAAGFRLLCPYDVAALDERTIHEARRSHPIVTDTTGSGPSARFPDAEELLAPFDAPLPKPDAASEAMAFDIHALEELRRHVGRRGRDADLSPLRVSDLVLAVNEIATNSIRHGGGNGVLRVWRTAGALVCEVRDRGHIRDPLVGRRRVDDGRLEGRGLWMAHQLCDLVQVRSGRWGTVVRLHMSAH